MSDLSLKMPRYEAYKDSGVEWIGEIPESWEIKPLTKYAKRVDYRGKTPLKVEEGIFLVTTKNIKNGAIDYKISQEFISEKQYYTIMSRGLPSVGDVLFTMEAPLGMSAVVDKEQIAIAQRIIKFRFNKKIFVSYFSNYSIQAEYFQNFVQKEGTGSTAKGMKASKLNKLKLIKPPLIEQTAIANFLDCKTAKIDQAVAIKEKQIQLLKERKQILIQTAVTKGLDPDVPMRNSGVEWIGEIPEHWDVFCVKRVFRLVAKPSEKNNNHELLSIYTDIGVKPRKELKEKGNKASTTDGYWLVQKGDFIVNKLLAWMGAIGLSEYKGVTSPAYDILRPIKQIDGYFYHFLFRTKECSAEMRKHSKGIMDMRLRLYFDKFGMIEVPYPPKREQKTIVIHIQTQSDKIDKAIAIQEQMIDKLREYKATLINSAVTGKIKVPQTGETKAVA